MRSAPPTVTQAPLVLLAGPTASGKTALALELARRLPCEIVSVDSGQVYRGLDIGTAKPGRAELESVPHHLIDLCEADQPYSAGAFMQDVRTAIEAIHARGRLPLLVGGTLLYFRALERGLAELPPADAAVRLELEARASRDGWETLHEELVRHDPAAAARIGPRDTQRIQRALEVYRITGIPLTQWQGQQLPAVALTQRFTVRRLVLAPAQRSTLHAAIERRVDGMFAAGLVGEVGGLRARGLSPALPALRAVGYRQIWRYLDGACTLSQARADLLAATRALARRQLTWLRGTPAGQWADAAHPATRDRFLRVLDSLCAFLPARSAG